jgi:hypothetical protein
MPKREDPEPEPLVDWESEHLTFRSIWQAANVLRDTGEMNEIQRFPSRMAAAVLVHAAYEGFVNDAIERLYPDVWKLELTYFRVGAFRGTLGKTRFLAEGLGVALERALRPYRTVAELNAWRNDLVHPRTARGKGTVRSDAYAKRPMHVRPPGFAKLTHGFIARCFDDVSALADMLLRAARQRHRAEVRDLGQMVFWGPTGSGGAALKQ